MGIFPHGLHGPGRCCIIGVKAIVPPQEDIMADYQEYRRRILHRRWRRVFITAALLILLVLLAAVGILWKRLHREPSPNTAATAPPSGRPCPASIIIFCLSTENTGLSVKPPIYKTVHITIHMDKSKVIFKAVNVLFKYITQ